MFSNQEQYFVNSIGDITSTYNDIYDVSDISSSGIGNTDISDRLQYLITNDNLFNNNNILFDNTNNSNNNWVSNLDIITSYYIIPTDDDFYNKQKNNDKIKKINDKFFPLLLSEPKKLNKQQSIYFKYQNNNKTVTIIDASNSLFKCLDGSNNIINYNIDNSNNPIKCERIDLSGDIIINGSDLTWNDTSKPYTISLKGKIIFDGKNNTVFLKDCSGWQGLIKSDSNSSNNRPTISNIDISGSGNTHLSKNNKFNGTSYLMRYGSLYFDLENCHNYIEIKDASYCGGLVP